LASLDATYVGLRNPRGGGELLLCEAGSQTLLQETGTDLKAGTCCIELSALFVGAAAFDLANEVVELRAHGDLLAWGTV